MAKKMNVRQSTIRNISRAELMKIAVAGRCVVTLHGRPNFEVNQLLNDEEINDFSVSQSPGRIINIVSYS
jgi:hypothetical protein